MADITGDGVNDFDITPAGSSVTIGGVVFTDAVNTGSGTGNYNTFLAISDNDGIEEGFNSDDTPPIDASNKDIDQAKTHTILLSNLVIVTVNGVQYYEFRVDLNEANSDPNAQISLDQFKLYTSTNGSIVDTTTLFSQNLIYDMDAGGNVSVLMSDAESSGSGTDDYAVLVPISEFAGLDPTTTYVYLFTRMGAAGTGWDATATFEEWNLQNGATLTGTKFSDLDNDGVKDAGEGPVAGVTIFIDANQNGVFDAGERSTVTDANGNYTFYGVATGQTIWIDEVTPAGATQTTGAHETVIIGDVAPGTVIVVDPIGNHYLTPHVTITKDASVAGDCADVKDELITYTITVDNDGELNLTSVVVKDNFEGGGDVTLVVTGDGGDGLDPGEVVLTGDDGDGILETNETWTYTYVRAVTQDMIDSNGGGDGTLDNTATVNASSTNGNVTDNDDASVEVCQYPGIAIDKVATIDDGGDCVDEDGDIINYTYSVTNTGNVALDNVVVVDDKVTVVADDGDSDGFNDGDLDEDGLLDLNETWTYTASYTVTQADLDANGDGDGFIHNTVTANGDAAVGGEAALEAEDSEQVEVCQLPGIAIDKVATLDDGGDCVDEDGDIINYTYSVTNTGNVALDNVVVVDDKVTVVADDADTDGFNDGDLDEDGLLDLNETWTYSASYTATQADIDAAGDGDGFIHNTVTANGDAAVGGEAALEAEDSEQVEVCQLPGIAIDKVATIDDGGDCVDEDGDIINYTYSVTNTGNVALDNVVVVDDKVTVVADDGDSDGFNDGDLDEDGLLDLNETWTYSASYTATQADIDNAGDGDGFIHNTVTANGEAAVSGIPAEEAEDSEQVEVCQLPDVMIVKNIRTDTTGGVYVPADDPAKPLADIVGSPVEFEVILTNTGNMTLTGITLTDVLDGANLDYNTVNGGGDAHVEIDADGDGIYEDSGSWTDFAGTDQTLDFGLGPNGAIRVTYAYESTLGNHVNVVTVTDDQLVTDNNEAGYYTVEEDCVGVRTPGFWQNKKWGLFWNFDPTKPATATDQDALPQNGTPGFATGELLYSVYLNPTDPDHNGSFEENLGAASAGLLIGDYNMNGYTDYDPGGDGILGTGDDIALEDTIFISLLDAQKLINASEKQLAGDKTADGIWMLGRDMVATWLNYLANNQEGDGGNCIGPVADDGVTSVREYLDGSIDWMQKFASVANDLNVNQTTFQFDPRVAPSSPNWQSPVSGIPFSGSEMHSQLDYYNNTGKIFDGLVNGVPHYTEYCCDADSELVLGVLAQISVI